MERDEVKHAEVMKRIEIQVKRENERASARQKRFEQIQQRLKEECQENSTDDR
jgi:hypothetical protein